MWNTTTVHDLDAKRLLFATEGREHKTVLDFVDDLKAHGGDSAQVEHVCMDMSAAYAKGVGLALPQAQISYDRFHVVAMAMDAMDQVRRTEMTQDAPAVRVALESAVDNEERKTLKQLMWGMRRNPESWSAWQTEAMHWLQRSLLKSARAWRLKMALSGVCEGQGAQQCTAGGCRVAGLAELGVQMPAGAVQEAGQQPQGTLCCGGARHVGASQ